MKKIYLAENAMIAHHVKALLDAAGIPAKVTGDSLALGIGIGPTELSTKPAVWIAENAQVQRALDLIREYESEAGHVKVDSWTCAECGESIEGQFAVCWRCDTPREIG